MSIKQQAIMILAVLASSGETQPWYGSTYSANKGLGFDEDDAAYSLAYSAWNEAFVAYDRPYFGTGDEVRQIYAEAESMLRTGWKP